MKPIPSNHDTTIEEIHRTRRRIAARFGGNLLAMIEDARKRQEISGHPMWLPQAPDQAEPSTDGTRG
jgi:hypothetical protein